MLMVHVLNHQMVYSYAEKHYHTHQHRQWNLLIKLSKFILILSTHSDLIVDLINVVQLTSKVAIVKVRGHAAGDACKRKQVSNQLAKVDTCVAYTSLSWSLAHKCC